MFQGGTKILWKSTSKQNCVEKRRSNDFSFWHIKNLWKRDIKTTTIFCFSKIHQNKHVKVVSVFHQNCIKKIHQNNVSFSYIKIRLKKVLQNHVDFFAHRNYVEKSTFKRCWFFSHQNCVEQSQSGRRWFFACWNYVKQNISYDKSIFLPLKLRQRKYVETTSKFRPSKLHKKSMSKWGGNSAIFSFRYIDLISTLKKNNHPPKHEPLPETTAVARSF